MTADLAARVAAERAAQGLPEHIEDDRVLNLVADLLAEVRPEHDDGPGSGKPGRRSRSAAAKQTKGRSNATGDRDRRAARNRLAAERPRLRHARLAHQLMDLALYYRRPPGLPMLPAGPAACAPGCPWCWWWAA